jgi:hypothetical protein
MLALAKKHRVLIGLAVVAVAIYLWQRSKKATPTKVSTGGNVLDPSNDAAMAKLFDQMNPGLKSS